MKVAIVGGGAAGLMATATLHEINPEVEIFIIEKNETLGKKVMISGGGRCNLTTGIQDIKIVLTKYPRGGKFLSSAMYKFPPAFVYNWFEDHGVPLKIEEDLRVFPKSNNGKDVVHVFKKIFKNPKIHTMLNTQVSNIQKIDGGFKLTLKNNNIPLLVDKLVLTTGGQAYRQTGSTGDGYTFAASLGHTVTKLAPSLSAFFTQEKWPGEVSGLSFPKAKLTARHNKNISFTGPLLFTHKGLSGPATFALSSLTAFEKYNSAHPLEISIDLFPDVSHDELKNRFEKTITLGAHKNFVNVLAMLIPKSLAEILCRESALPEEKSVSEINKKQAARCLNWLKNIPLHIIARGAGDEFVTAGGVNLKEVNPSTMESKICPGLYLAGEILDIDGLTGGFNLQSAWTTGHLAGENICDTQ